MEGSTDGAASVTQDADMSMGIMAVITPVVTAIDESVAATRQSQTALKDQIDLLQQELDKFSDQTELNVALDEYIGKLSQSRQKVQSINSLLHSVQDRVNRLHLNVTKASKRLQDQRAKRG